MKKMFTIFIAVMFAFSLLLTGCKTADKANEQTNEDAQTTATPAPSTVAAEEASVSGKIVFASNRTDMDEKLAEIIADFNVEYPEIEVEVQPIQDYTTAMKTRLASQDAPDVLYVNGGIVPTKDLYPQFFEPLDDLGYNSDSIYFYDDGVYENSVYMLCEGVYVTGVLCDKATLAGVGINEYPKTWDELMKDCELLKSAGITPFGSMVKTKWPLSSWLTAGFTDFTGSGADYYNSLTESDAPFTADSPVGKMLSTVNTIREKGYFDADPASSDWDILRTDMSKTGFLLLANYGLSALDGTLPENVGFFPLPVDNSGKQYTSMSSGWDMAISKNSKNKEAAKAFVKYWLNESSYQDATGIIPSVKAKESSVAQVKEFMANNLSVFQDSGASDEYNQILSAGQFGVEDLVQEVILGKPVSEVLDSYNKKWSAAKASIQ